MFFLLQGSRIYYVAQYIFWYVPIGTYQKIAHIVKGFSNHPQCALPNYWLLETSYYSLYTSHIEKSAPADAINRRPAIAILPSLRRGNCQLYNFERSINVYIPKANKKPSIYFCLRRTAISAIKQVMICSIILAS